MRDEVFFNILFDYTYNDLTEIKIKHENFKNLSSISKINSSSRSNKSTIRMKPKKDLIIGTTLKIDKKNSVKTIEFGTWNTINAITCCKKNRPKKYDILNEYLREKLDVGYYLKNVGKLDKVKNMLFSREENIAFMLMKKPNINIEEDLKDIILSNKEKDKEIKIFVGYIRDKIESKRLSERDECLLAMVDNHIRDLIYS